MRVPAEGGRLAPDRLREPLPRLPGHVLAPPLPLAGAREAALGDVLRRHRAPLPGNLDWAPFFEIASGEAPFPEKLEAYGALARERLQADEFEAFREEHLGELDEVAWEYFGTDDARAAVRSKVEALFPEHEHDEFTDRFFAAIQTWRDEEAAR